MKHQSGNLLGTITAFLLSMIFCISTSRAGVEAKDTYWTNVEGVTIWARLAGIQGSTVLLVMRGRGYHVPLNRLTPESVAKARRMLDATPATATVSRPNIKPSATTTVSCPKIQPTPSVAAGAWIPVPQTEPEITTDLADISAESSPGGLPEKGEIPPPTQLPETPVELGAKIRMDGRLAIAPSGVPSFIQTAIAAGNRMQDKFYKWGGGRAQLEDNGYDCSGSVSYVLIKAGLPRAPLTSGGFMRYGEPGPGRWITVYARNGHVFMTLCGLRLDTGGHAGKGESGPRWRTNPRSIRGFVMRHPSGF